jgi:hypothetical protein
MIFQTKRSKQIDECLRSIMAQSFIAQTSRLTIADMLRDALDDQGISMSLQSAYHKVCHYTNKQQRIFNKALKNHNKRGN